MANPDIFSKMSETEIRHRKKLQSATSRTTSTLGLAGVGVGTAAVLASKKPGALKQIRRVPGMKKATGEGLKDAGLYTSLASGGIGGIGGYNFAAYTSAESKKKKPAMTTVKKIGEWKTIDQRELSQRRSRKYMRAGGAAAGAGVGLALLHRKPGDAKHAMQAGRLIRHAVTDSDLNVKGKAKLATNIVRRESKHFSTGQKGGAALVAGGAAVGVPAKAGHTYQQHKINERRRTKFKGQIKKDGTSAFGVQHDRVDSTTRLRSRG